MIATSLAHIVSALEADDAEARRVAAETLGALGPLSISAVEAMIERSIVDESPSVRYALLWALEQVPWRDVDGLQIFVRLLQHDDEVTQAYAAWAIGKIGPDGAAAVADLAAVAGDFDRLVDPRWSAVVALERLGTSATDAVPALLTILDDDRADMREATTRALGEITDGRSTPQVVAAIAELLRDAHPHVRESAAAGLVAAGVPLSDRTQPVHRRHRRASTSTKLPGSLPTARRE